MPRSRTLTLAIILSAITAGTIYAHVSGRLVAVYSALGLRTAQGDGQTVTAGSSSPGSADPSPHEGHGEHAGHESHEMHSDATMPGMEMPGMEMSKGAGANAGAEPSRLPGHSVVTIAPERQQLIGVRIGKVQRDRLLMSIRAVGIVEPDQTRLARIQTRVKGWVTKLFVDFVGQKVAKNDRLLELYSPELLATQQEYLIARSRGNSAPNNTTQSYTGSSLRRLELDGVAPEEIKELERSGTPRETLLLRSPIAGTVLERSVFDGSYVEPATELYRIADLSVVWVQAKIYEYELPHISIDQPVTVTLQSEPDTELSGKVAFVEPLVQEATRTVKVRVAVENADEYLKPGMYANLRIDHDMGEGLLVPESAVLRTGERAICFRALRGNRFEPVEVQLGARFGDRMEILSGLADGENVVVSAGFLIDSESRLKSTSAGAMGGHKHGN